MATHLVWFRADLRIHDNLALAAACRDPHAEVLGMFIATPGQWRQHGMAPRQAAFMVSHLHSLQVALAEKGVPLQIEQAEDFAASVTLLASVCERRQVTHLFYNYQYEINERQRDATVEKRWSGWFVMALMTASCCRRAAYSPVMAKCTRCLRHLKMLLFAVCRKRCRRASPRRKCARVGPSLPGLK